ncbi:MAG: cation-translocating P-type ATPase [Flavobacteriales bacterium]|nr:cation-translocating P-type ATPase [Flavobacteriales bacterium]
MVGPILSGGDSERNGEQRASGAAHVHLAIGGVWCGYFVIGKRLRPGSAKAVEQLRARLQVALLTGDAQVDAELAEAFQGAQVRTRCSPVDKAQEIIQQQQRGHRVLMVGDGLNDAGALAQSDVGITVTETTAALTPASDAILDATRGTPTAHVPAAGTPCAPYRFGQLGYFPLLQPGGCVLRSYGTTHTALRGDPDAFELRIRCGIRDRQRCARR